MADLSQAEVDKALKGLERYRVMAAQEIAAEGPPDEFSGALLLSLGLRESHLRNINNPAETDHGCFQITELFHAVWLASEPGCPAGSWRVEAGHTALEDGYCPRFTTACIYALELLKFNANYAKTKVPDADPLRFAVAAYNSGIGGALKGHREGDVEKYTAHGDYVTWVLAHRAQVNHFHVTHPEWRP
jgi:hypothetical protein